MSGRLTRAVSAIPEANQRELVTMLFDTATSGAQQGALGFHVAQLLGFLAGLVVADDTQPDVALHPSAVAHVVAHETPLGIDRDTLAEEVDALRALADREGDGPVGDLLRAWADEVADAAEVVAGCWEEQAGLDVGKVYPILDAAVEAMSPSDKADRLARIERGAAPARVEFVETAKGFRFSWGGRPLATIPKAQLRAHAN